jgi:type IV secretory pathway VirB10-like protein
MSDSSRSASPKLDPESLVLTARPRRIARFRRWAVISVAAVACAAICGATLLALNGSGLRRESGGGELYNVDHKATAEGLARLPANYSQMAKPQSAPQLGGPLPGDIGPSVVQRERTLGIPPVAENTNFRPSAEDDAARAERMRLAQQARQASEAGVFFRLASGEKTPGGNAQPPAQREGPPGAPQPAAADSNKLNLDPERDQNYQQRKLDLLNRKADPSIYNPHGIQDPVSPYEVLAGSIIAASLITGIKSDLPGEITAQVTENVYDTVTGRTLLIPQGARLIGTYDSVVAFGQSRALLVWQRIIMPDGSSVLIDNLPAADAAGYSGLEDEVDYHTWQLLKGIALSTLLGVGGQVTFGTQDSNLVQAIRESTQESTNRAGQRIVEKNLNVQPTITVRPGWPLRVVVHKDLVLRPYRV